MTISRQVWFTCDSKFNLAAKTATLVCIFNVHVEASILVV